MAQIMHVLVNRLVFPYVLLGLTGCIRPARVAPEGLENRSAQDAPLNTRCRITGGSLGGDMIKAVPDGPGVVFRITRRTGISNAEVVLVEGEWPQPMRLKFIGFGNLESLQLHYENLCLVAAYDQDRARDNEFSMPLKREGRSIVVELPANLFRRNVKTFTLNWIDAFRK